METDDAFFFAFSRLFEQTNKLCSTRNFYEFGQLDLGESYLVELFHEILNLYNLFGVAKL